MKTIMDFLFPWSYITPNKREHKKTGKIQYYEQDVYSGVWNDA